MNAASEPDFRYREPQTSEHIIEDLLDWSLTVPCASVVLGLEWGLDRIKKMEQSQDDGVAANKKKKFIAEQDGIINGSVADQSVKTNRRHPLTQICFKPEVASCSAAGTYTPDHVVHNEEHFARILSNVTEAIKIFEKDQAGVSTASCQGGQDRTDSKFIGLTEAFVIPIMLPSTHWNIIEKQQPRKNGWSDAALDARKELMSRTAHEVYDAYVRLQGLDEATSLLSPRTAGKFSTEQTASDNFAEKFLEALINEENKLYDANKAHDEKIKNQSI